MATKTEPYVDTSAFVAVLDVSDSYHGLFRRLFSEPPKLWTTPLVIGETHAWFLRRFDVSRGLQFLGFIEALTPLRIVEIGSSEIAESCYILRAFKDQKLTITDALGLALMKKHKTKQCWSTDRHLGLTGVPLAIYL